MAKKTEMDTRFSKFGTVSFTAITKVNDFIDYLEEGSVMATRCTDCGMIFFPPRADCYRCLASNMEWVAVTGIGKLVTYSKLQYAPVGFGDDLPYAIALLDYGDYKVFGRIAASVPEDEIKIGMDMKTVANRLPDGRINYVFEKA
jgi:uncharacterized OB-fold protein